MNSQDNSGTQFDQFRPRPVPANAEKWKPLVPERQSSVRRVSKKGAVLAIALTAGAAVAHFGGNDVANHDKTAKPSVEQVEATVPEGGVPPEVAPDVAPGQEAPVAPEAPLQQPGEQGGYGPEDPYGS